MRVLGIDPGLRITGYGCVESARLDPTLIEAGVFRLTGAGKRETVSDRLLELETDIAALIERLRPETVAVEALFAHYKHPATAISMGHARGVILLSIRRAGLTLVELKPNEVKKFLTGNGHAGKEQMQEAVKDRLGLKAAPEPPDVADAIAIAMCAAARAQFVP
ncbi:MAG: crossover junction endodeoxyribonuclease RuvC [Phycisphaeraceae bacterium]|nr:crossover junction endodeoxyribonuclease RuvC [Phycisphaeraceae bacterium]